ncbi:peptidase S41-like protein [Metamycoplasma subdolum]|uniref:Peptidase S41-like protein n=1 Tax=Metamycoplasma subdolum TaxID=92407 RepID=A0A3L9ZXE6_9BACT|nr:S41 family peptidase [Metamycoplasma subdolum]RMA77551.1 peptidase S41-like protein [Metamycoplasma subdolum]WPB50345.1 S41 family peptidase [Metamycoplasma subdolum]
MKKIGLFLTLMAVPLPLVVQSCAWHLNDNNKIVKIEDIPFNNFNNQYNVKPGKIRNYYIKENAVPYISLRDTIHTLNGFLQAEKHMKFMNPFANQWHAIDPSSVMNRMTVDWKDNKIYVDSSNFFYFAFPSQTINYMKHLRTIDSWSNLDKSRKIVFDLNKYGFDILNYKNNILIPYPIFNSLFCSPNYYSLYFNGDNYSGVYFGLSDQDADINDFRNNFFATQLQSAQMRQDSINHLAFSYDFYYGLRDEKLNSNSFNEWLKLSENDELEDNLLSQEPAKYSKGYFDFIYNKLNDRHSWIQMRSFFDGKDAKISEFNSIIQNSPVRKEAKTSRDILSAGRTSTEYLTFYKDMARITFDGFENATNHELETSTTPWLIDTYELLKKAMEEIQEKGSSVKNIVIDLSQNGGGYVSAMIKALGFLTNDNIAIREFEKLGNVSAWTKYKLNRSKSLTYDPSDYNWTILTSNLTFSAANEFVSVFNDMELGLIVGKKSGGGACSIVPVILPDGTTISFSSNNQGVNKNWEIIENGIDVHKEIPLEDFYDDEKLWQAINF